jgi:serine/threonine-protein kinase
MDKVYADKIGKYKIIKTLGRGGMGEVVLALDEDLGRRVAIKRPFESAQGEGLARFQVEAKAATLRHPNIPAVYEMGEQDGLPFIAMEFVEGESLDRIIASGKQFGQFTKLRIIEQVCLALGYAHKKGVIHRDIKPANVIVQPDGVAKIIDFGIAKIQETDGKTGLTQTSQVIGSLHYIAPERFKGQTIDGRVDIFSAGVTLYKLLTGEEPFTGDDATASYKIVNEPHTPLATYLHDYPTALDEIMNKALAKNPEDRYSTGEDFADAIHEVIEDLKQSRVTELFSDAERLTMESRFAPALELLEEAVQLDPANTQVRKLRKFVREHQERARRAERIRECTIRADEALSSGNFAEALTQLRDAQKLDSTSEDIQLRIRSVEDRKRRYEMSARALAEAESVRGRGDVTAALRIVTKALQEDPGNQKLLVFKGVLDRQLEIDAQRGRILEIIEVGHRELAARNLDAVDKLLAEADSIDPSNLEIDKLRWELAKVREQEQRRVVLDEIQTRIGDFLKAGSYDQAADLLNRALEKLPNETMLHRLRAEVDTEARKFEAKRFVDAAISQAKELFASSPLEALGILQKALDQMPGEERLVSYERSLRIQLDDLRVEQVRAGTLAKARELISAKQHDKAIGVLESFQIEFGQHADINDLLVFARDELANLKRSAMVEHCASEGRALIRDGRLEDAVQLLEQGSKDTGDASLSRLLEEARKQQVDFTRKLELLQKKVAILRGRGEFDESIRLLQEQLALTPGQAGLQETLTALLVDQKCKQVTGEAIDTARKAALEKNFSAGLESLQAVLGAYGESKELTRAIQEIEAARSSHAKEAVGQSIESARAALLKNDPRGALAALKSVTPMIEFADQKKQADWQRIGEAVKNAIEQAGKAGSGVALEAQLAEIAHAKPKRMPIWAISAVSLALVAVIAFAIWKTHAPAAPVVAHIKIVKAPPGALISIDNGPNAQADANGELTIQTQPGLHQLHVSKDGFQPFNDKLDVSAGETVKDELSLTKLLPAGSSGTLSPRGNLAEFKLSVDGKNMGTHRVGESIPLESGTHKIAYSALDNSDTQEHTIKIAANQNTPDTFVLKPGEPKPSTGGNDNVPAAGKLIVQTNPGASIAIDGQFKGVADAGGKYAVQGIGGGQHAVWISMDGFQPANRQVTIAIGQTQTLAAQLQAVTSAAVAQAAGSLSVNTNSIERGQSVTLTWQVNNASSISISGIGSVAPQGSRTVSPGKTTTYQLMANGVSLSEQTVNVSEPSPVVATRSGAPEGPDRAALEQSLNAYKSVFGRASGKSSKDCKGVLNGIYQGRLQALARWCDTAKSFDVNEQCGQVGGSPDAPTLTCSETLVIHPKDGDPQQFHSQKIFRYAKNPDGTWLIAGW